RGSSSCRSRPPTPSSCTIRRPPTSRPSEAGVRRLDIDGWLGLVVDGQRLLVRSATAAVVLRTLVAYPQAVLVELDVYARGGSATRGRPRAGGRNGGWFTYGDRVEGDHRLLEVEVGFG